MHEISDEDFFHEHINFFKITINGEKIIHTVREFANSWQIIE